MHDSINMPLSLGEMIYEEKSSYKKRYLTPGLEWAWEEINKRYLIKNPDGSYEYKVPTRKLHQLANKLGEMYDKGEIDLNDL